MTEKEARTANSGHAVIHRIILTISELINANIF
jgi:hypothetical protein